MNYKIIDKLSKEYKPKNSMKKRESKIVGENKIQIIK